MKVRNDHSAPINAGGGDIAPGATGDADVTKDSPFVRAGWLVPTEDQGTAQSGPSAKERREEAESSNDLGRLNELAEDSAKTVREAAEFRIAELEEADKTGE